MKPEEQEDVALRIAATMFQEQILVAYLNQDPDFNLAKTIKNVTAFSSNIALMIARFNVNIANGQNRE